MFPVYPLLLLAAAVTMSAVARAVAGGRRGNRVLLLAVMVMGCAALSALRSAALVRYYRAPLRLYSDMYYEAEQQQQLSVSTRPKNNAVACVGNEWYRFPSSFFLPRNAELAYIKDGFTGQLPSRFTAPWPEGSRAVHTHFNGMNREEASRYVPLASCDVLVDLMPASGAADEAERRRLHRGRRPARSAPFLDAARSAGWSRALYIPHLSNARNVFVEYAMLVRESSTWW